LKTNLHNNNDHRKDEKSYKLQREKQREKSTREREREREKDTDGVVMMRGLRWRAVVW
jgi:hypothetical protein